METIVHAPRLPRATGICLFVALAGHSWARPGALVSVSKFSSRADSIIVATIIEGSEANDVATAILKVERVLKGSLVPGATVSVTWTNPPNIPPPFRKPAPDQGLFFLAKDATGAWSILSGSGGGVDFQMTYFLLPNGPQPAQYVSAPSAPVLDKVLLELAWAKETGVARNRFAVYDLVSEFRRSRSSAMRPVFARFTQSSSPKLRTMGLQALIVDGDVQGLTRLEAEQKNLLTAPFGSEVFSDVKYYFGNSDPAAVAVLGRLATSPASIPEVKDAAAAALARMHTKESLPYLAELLDSPVAAIRAYAVGGLAMFANNMPIGKHEPAPGDWAYRTAETIAHSSMDPGRIAAREAYYVGFWKDWWASNRVRLAGR